MGPPKSAAVKWHLDRFNAIFAGLTNVINRQTQRLSYCICSSGLHLAVAVMWPNNINNHHT